MNWSCTDKISVDPDQINIMLIANLKSSTSATKEIDRKYDKGMTLLLWSLLSKMSHI